MYVGGDDFYCILLQKDRAKFEYGVSELFMSTTVGTKGLG